MQTFAGAVTGEVAQQAVARLPWGHITVLLDKVPDPTERDFHVTRAAQHGWSRTMLTHHFVTGLNARAGEAVTNFSATLGREFAPVAEIVRDPYNVDFSP